MNLVKEKQKRLGQHFSGLMVSRLLSALSKIDSKSNIIDPMSGRGDMLKACIELGAHHENILGVEIDPEAYREHCDQIGEKYSILGDAFDPKLLDLYYEREWDLVITNPPYIRYQSFKNSFAFGVSAPNAEETRKNLALIIANNPNFDPIDKDFFLFLVNAYSGLSDFAVPCWILSASLVKPGGYLSIVMSESWLSRDYAAIVRYILLRWFDIEFVVDDENSSWFKEAQVKTSLIVARRTQRKYSAFGNSKKKTFCKISIPSTMANRCSLVGNFSSGKNPEKAFVEYIRKRLKENRYQSKEIEFFPVAFEKFEASLLPLSKNKKWLPKLEKLDNLKTISSSANLPQEIDDWLLKKTAKPVKFTTLEAEGISVGQGLRTGANKFFYVDFIKQNSTGALIEPHKFLKYPKFSVSIDFLQPVIRRQAELCGKYSLNRSTLKGRLLFYSNREIQKKKSIELEKFIKYVEGVNFGTIDTPKKIVELSAVAPNIRKGNLSQGIKPKFWYMLPELRERHKPDIFVPRIIHDQVTAYFNKKRKVVVDANFTTLWLKQNLQIDAFAILALLNSTWCKVLLEFISSIMGGGALKVEATHIRRLPIPVFNIDTWKQLSIYGESLSSCLVQGKSKVLDKIDSEILNVILGRVPIKNEIEDLKKLGRKMRKRRRIKKI